MVFRFRIENMKSWSRYQKGSQQISIIIQWKKLQDKDEENDGYE